MLCKVEMSLSQVKEKLKVQIDLQLRCKLEDLLMTDFILQTLTRLLFSCSPGMVAVGLRKLACHPIRSGPVLGFS